MSDGKFPIEIKTTLQGDGLKDTAAQMENVTAKSEESTRKQVEGGEKLKLNHRELRESIRAVAAQFGGLADVGLWLSPVTAALAIVLTAVEALKSAFERLRKPVEDAAEAMDKIDDSQIKSVEESASKLATDLGEIANHESALQAALGRSDTELENSIRLYNARRDAVVRVAEAEERAFEQLLDLQSESNPGLKEENEARKEKARLQLDALRGSNDEAKLQNEIQTRNVALMEAQHRLGAANTDRNAITAADRAAAVTAVEAAKAKAELENARSADISGPNGPIKMADALKRRADLESALQDMDETGATTHQFSPLEKRNREQIEQEKNALDQAINAHKAYVRGLGEIADKADVANKKAEQSVKNAKDQADADQKRVVEEPERIRTLEQERDILRQTNAATQAANARGAAYRAAAGNVRANEGALGQAESLAHELEEHGGSNLQYDRLITIMQRAIANRASFDQAGQRRLDQLERDVQHLWQIHDQAGVHQ